MMINAKRKIQVFSEAQEQTLHYLSNFAEMLHASDYVAEQAGVSQVTGWVIKDVEIFAAGTWKGITYTDQDLEHMVQHFYDLKDAEKFDPVFKVNHSEDARDQVGWILDVRKDGSILTADIHVTEWEAYDKIQSGTWKKVSAEIYLPELAQAEFGINDYVLRAVAVVSIPAVKDIKGIVLNSERWDNDPGQNKYKGGDPKVEKFLQFLSEMGITLTDDQKAAIEAKKADMTAMFAEGAQTVTAPATTFNITADQIVALSEKITGLEKGSSDLADKVAELTKNSKQVELDKWFTSLSEAGKVVPAEKEEIMAFAEKLEGESLEAYKKTFEKRVSVVQFGEAGAQQQNVDQTDAAWSSFNEHFAQKKY
jgi:phage I-like protein